MTTCCIFERVWSEHLLVHLDRAEKRPIALLPITPSLIRRVLPSAFNSFCLSIEWRPNTICLKRAGREFTMHCTWKQNWIQKRNEGGRLPNIRKSSRPYGSSSRPSQRVKVPSRAKHSLIFVTIHRRPSSSWGCPVWLFWLFKFRILMYWL